MFESNLYFVIKALLKSNLK